LETHVALVGPGADCQLSAIYMGRGKQHQDITTYMDHAVAECTSNQIIRGVLDDSSRGVYQGRVHVAPDAQKTDGQQMARALLLSRKAEADAKPELEIYADDVVCAHGATVGELDATQLFYLTSRGIPYETARAMLIEAFLIDTIETIENDVLAGLLRPVAEAWLAGGETA
jgi:Fe-S cluster assembly protein SufD